MLDDAVGGLRSAAGPGRQQLPLARRASRRPDEWLVLLKTRADLAERVVDAVVDAHPYETPEVVTLDITGGAAGYLDWIIEST